ncbi:MAG TPA: helix-turn-helix transcriptional regulator [Thermoanaerobaculia bacterium]|nr:helix-turn-helix transcriptional regulator [Thermoanaerobaculia bacterium]
MQLLIEARVEAGLSQAALGKRLKRPQSFVSKYETAERRLDFAETVHVAEAIGITADDLLRRFLQMRVTRGRRTSRARGASAATKTR